MAYGIHIDRFSTIDHLTKKQLQIDEVVLEALRRSPRVSTFEMSENANVRGAVQRLVREKKIELNNDLGYPWHGVKILPEGKNEHLSTTGESK